MNQLAAETQSVFIYGLRGLLAAVACRHHAPPFLFRVFRAASVSITAALIASDLDGIGLSILRSCSTASRKSSSTRMVKAVVYLTGFTLGMAFCLLKLFASPITPRRMYCQ